MSLTQNQDGLNTLGPWKQTAERNQNEQPIQQRWQEDCGLLHNIDWIENQVHRIKDYPHTDNLTSFIVVGQETTE